MGGKEETNVRTALWTLSIARLIEEVYLPEPQDR